MILQGMTGSWPVCALLGWWGREQVWMSVGEARRWEQSGVSAGCETRGEWKWGKCEDRILADVVTSWSRPKPASGETNHFMVLCLWEHVLPGVTFWLFFFTGAAVNDDNQSWTNKLKIYKKNKEWRKVWTVLYYSIWRESISPVVYTYIKGAKCENFFVESNKKWTKILIRAPTNCTANWAN